MNPVRQGDGVGLSAAGFSEVREGDGTVLWSQGGAIPDSAVLFYTYESGSGTVIDEANGYDGSLVGGPTYNTTTVANGTHSMGFNGADDGLTFPAVTEVNDFDGSAAYTVTFWLYPRTLPSSTNFRLVSFESSSNTFIQYIGSGGYLEFGFYDGSNSIGAASDGSLTADAWQFITARWDPSGDYTISIDTTQKGSNTTGTPANAGANNAIAFRDSGNNLYSDVIIDGFGVHDKILTSAEETDIYQRGPA